MVGTATSAQGAAAIRGSRRTALIRRAHRVEHGKLVAARRQGCSAVFLTLDHDRIAGGRILTVEVQGPDRPFLAGAQNGGGRDMQAHSRIVWAIEGLAVLDDPALQTRQGAKIDAGMDVEHGPDHIAPPEHRRRRLLGERNGDGRALAVRRDRRADLTRGRRTCLVSSIFGIIQHRTVRRQVDEIGAVRPADPRIDALSQGEPDLHCAAVQPHIGGLHVGRGIDVQSGQQGQSVLGESEGQDLTRALVSHQPRA